MRQQIVLEIFYQSLKICLGDSRDITAKELFSLLKNKYAISLEEIEDIMNEIYSKGEIVKKIDNEEVSFSFLSLMNTDRKIDFPDGSFLYVKNQADVSEWKKIIAEGIKAKFPQELKYYQ
ncbi:MAG: hypothetical protein JST87_15035 [Bacteroidetes bacterium]|nr:hypothetical protein [Bacteroidota bacterium]